MLRFVIGKRFSVWLGVQKYLNSLSSPITNCQRFRHLVIIGNTLLNVVPRIQMQ